MALCRAELDRSPFIIAVNQKIMNYYSYRLSKDNKSFLCRKIFITLVKIVIILINNFPCFDVTYQEPITLLPFLLDVLKLTHYVGLMQQSIFYIGNIPCKTPLN